MDRDELHPTEGFVRVPRSSRTGTVVSVRLDAQEATALHRLARERKGTISQVARDAIRTYLYHPVPATPGYYRPSFAAAGDLPVSSSYAERLGTFSTQSSGARSIIKELVMIG